MLPNLHQTRVLLIESVANKSRWVSLDLHSAVTAAPGCILTSPMTNQFRQPGVFSHLDAPRCRVAAVRSAKIPLVPRPGHIKVAGRQAIPTDTDPVALRTGGGER